MEDDDYAGSATVQLNQVEVPVQVRLIAVHQPVDGRIHWSGRIAANSALHEQLGGTGATALLRTPHGDAEDAQIGDLDPWGRYRITGTGKPPFPLPEPPVDD
jgi:uncharacterized protein DUF4873